MNEDISVEVEEFFQGIMQTTTNRTSENYNPFKDKNTRLSKIIFLLDKQPLLQKGELDQFFNTLTKPKNQYTGNAKRKKTEQEYFQEGIYWRDKRQPNKPNTDALKILQNHKIVEEILKKQLSITFNPITFEIIQGEVKKDGLIDTKPRNKKRLQLTAPLFDLLIYNFGLNGLFSGELDLIHNKQLDKLNEIMQKFENDPLLKEQIEQKFLVSGQKLEGGIADLIKKGIQEKRTNAIMQANADIIQKHLNKKQFLKKLSEDFTEYYNFHKNNKENLRRIYEGNDLTFTYYNLLMDFLTRLYDKVLNEVKTKKFLRKPVLMRYTYAEVYSILLAKSILPSLETGQGVSISGFTFLYEIWNSHDTQFIKIEAEIKKELTKRGLLPKNTTVHGNFKHAVPQLLR